MSFLDAVKEMIPAEIINGSDVDETAKMVDLEVAYKLLLVEDYVHSRDEDFERYSNIPPVVKAEKRVDGKYEIRFQTEDGPDFRILTEENAKVMRARFLLLKGFYVTNIDRLTLPKQNEVAGKYDIGFIPDILKHLKS